MIEQLTFPLLAFLVAVFGYGGWFAVFKRKHTWFWSVLGLLRAISVGLTIAAGVVPGWDALAYALALVFIALPALAALSIGGGVGWYMRSNLSIPS